MKYLSIVLSLAIIIIATAVPFTTFAEGDFEKDTPQMLLLTLNSPANNSIITQFDCDFTFTPTLLGSDKFYSANLVISSGNDAIGGFSQYYKTNQTAITNASINTISFTFNQNGTYAWNVRIYNSSHSILAAETLLDGTEKPVSYILQVAVYEPSTSPSPTPIPTPTPTATPSPNPTTTPYPTQSPTPSPTITTSPTLTPTPNPSSSATPNPTPTATPTTNPSISPTPTANPSATPNADPSSNPTITPTPTPEPTQTASPTVNPTNNVTPTIHPSPTPAITIQPNQTATPTPTAIPIESPTPIPSEKPHGLSPEDTLLVGIITFILVDAVFLLVLRQYILKPREF